jgi:hypothetical protein
VGKKHVFFRFMLFLVVCPDWLWKGQVCTVYWVIFGLISNLLGHIWSIPLMKLVNFSPLFRLLEIEIK